MFSSTSLFSSIVLKNSLLHLKCYRPNVSKIVRAISSNSSDDRERTLQGLIKDASIFGEAGAAVPAEGELEWATQPYADGAHPITPTKIDPSETSVLLFPGQGSHFVGMGRRLMNVPTARDIYELASEVLGYNMASLCKEGPAKELEHRNQTAIMVTSLAALEAARDSRPGTIESIKLAAGYSLGEITALVFAGALRMEQALKLVEIRTAAMQEASRSRLGGMLTVWLSPDANLKQLLGKAREAVASAVQDPVCEISNYLYPNCKILAGDRAALQFIESNGRKYGVRRTARVPVEGAYHTTLMAQAQDVVAEALKLCDVSKPRVRVVSCVDAKDYRSEVDVRKRVAQLTTLPVRWEQTLHCIYARKRTEAQPFTVTLGPGEFLRSTLKYINAPAWDASVQIDV